MLTEATLKGGKELNIHLGCLKQNFIRKNLLNEIGAFVDMTVKTRTIDDQQNVDLMTMPGYSDYWAQVRDDAGLQTDAVDLFFTGSMFAALTHKTDQDSVTSYFLPTKDKEGASNPEKAFCLDESFNFFGLNAGNRNDILEIVDDHVKKVMRGRK